MVMVVTGFIMGKSSGMSIPYGDVNKVGNNRFRLFFDRLVPFHPKRLKVWTLVSRFILSYFNFNYLLTNY